MPGSQAGHLLDDPAAAVAQRVPDDPRAGVRPVALAAGDRAEAVDERGPAVEVQPQRLDLVDRGARRAAARGRTTVPMADQLTSSRRIRSTAAAISSRRGADVRRQPVALGAAGLRQPVEAPRAALGMLPLARDEALGLQRAQQRIHRVRVDREQPAGQRADALHELVAVRRAGAQQVQDEQPQQPGPAQAGEQRVARPRPALPVRRRRRASRRRPRGRRSGRPRLRRRPPSRDGEEPSVQYALRVGISSVVARRRRAARGAARAASDVDQAVAVAGSSMRRGSSVSRAMTSRWICDVPS